jgi:ribonuclease HI
MDQNSIIKKPRAVIFVKGQGGDGVLSGFGAFVDIHTASGETESFQISGNIENESRNRAGMLALVYALRFLFRDGFNHPVEIIADAVPILTGINGGAKRWKACGWRNSSNAPTADHDLWEEFLSLVEGRKIEAFRANKDTSGRLTLAEGLAARGATRPGRILVEELRRISLAA